MQRTANLIRDVWFWRARPPPRKRPMMESTTTQEK